MKHTLLFTFLFFLLAGCQEVIFTPKPRGYPRVHYPDKKFQTFEEEYCNFTFEYPQYGLIQQDKDFFEEEPWAFVITLTLSIFINAGLMVGFAAGIKVFKNYILNEVRLKELETDNLKTAQI